MRAAGKDIVELFGYRADDLSAPARQVFDNSECPFVGGPCTKRNSEKTVVYGVCSVTNGKQKAEGTEVIICPKRLYADSHKTLKNVADSVWGDLPFVIGGTKDDLKSGAMGHLESVVAFGQGSGNEVGVPGEARLSMDWVLQRYKRENGELVSVDFIGIEVQSIDITTNYRDCHTAYRKMRAKNDPDTYIPNSEHGLNWANVHKRLVPQILQKGNVYKGAGRCRGFFFVVPDTVFQRFESLLGELPMVPEENQDVLSVHTYSLGENVPDGYIRALELCREVHIPLSSISAAYVNLKSDEEGNQLDEKLKGIL